MPNLNENALTRVATVTGVSLNTTSKQTLYTVPVGMSFVPTLVIVRNVSADASTGQGQFGGNAAADDWLDDVELSNLDAAGEAIAVRSRGINPAGSGIPDKAEVYAETVEFGFKMNTTVAATCDMEVFGYLF
jgi:hypothetical protein